MRQPFLQKTTCRGLGQQFRGGGEVQPCLTAAISAGEKWGVTLRLGNGKSQWYSHKREGGKGKVQTYNPSFGWKTGKLNPAVCYSSFLSLLWVTEPPSATHPHSCKHFPPSSETPVPDRQDLFHWRIPSPRCQVYFCTLFGHFCCLANSNCISLASQALMIYTSPESSRQTQKRSMLILCDLQCSLASWVHFPASAATEYRRQKNGETKLVRRGIPGKPKPVKKI